MRKLLFILFLMALSMVGCNRGQDQERTEQTTAPQEEQSREGTDTTPVETAPATESQNDRGLENDQENE